MEEKKEKINLNALIIHPKIEPGVIDNAMLTRCILAHGPTEEAGRLFALEGVHLNETKIVRLEFEHILRIDHLWMLTSLTKLVLAHNLIERIENLHSLTNLVELDLSFNKIEKIENLETLVHLEVLTLFNNQIRKLENLDTLTVSLLIFSIGDNLIEDYKEVAYLRRFRSLRSVSLKGNPCCDDIMAYHFWHAALWKVTYIDYKLVSPSQREDGRAFFRGLLRKLDEADEKREKEFDAKVEYDKNTEFYAVSFVEYLSGGELLETMFEKDPDGSMLLKVGGELLTYYEVYKSQYAATMADLVNFAQVSHNDRQTEIKLYTDLVNKALEESVEKSKVVLADFEVKKAPLIEQMDAYIQKCAGDKKNSVEDLEPEVAELSDDFNDLLFELWKNLMTIEMNLFEQCEESRVQFSVNITEKITKLLENSRNAFGLWRELEMVWSQHQQEALSKLLGNKVMLGDVAPELFDVMMDKDLMTNAVATSMDNHLRFIDTREDTLTNRAVSWKDDFCENVNDNEIKRNRDRILEINYFIDNQKEDWADKQMNIIDHVDPETAALLGDDF